MLKSGNQYTCYRKKNEIDSYVNDILIKHPCFYYAYSKCEELELAADPENKLFTPCSVAKYNWMMKQSYKTYQTEIKSASVIVTLTLMMLFCYFSVSRRGGYHLTSPYILNSV